MSSSERDISSSRILITGASRGIGRALALEVATLGAVVHTLQRSEVVPDHPGITAHAVDVTDEASVRGVLASIGALDVVVNNASILGERAQLVDCEVALFRRTLEINTTGTFLVLKHAIPLVVASTRGLIVNLSSSVGVRGRAEWGAYSVSKFGVEALTEIAAQELLGAGVPCVSVNPGGTATGMRAEAYPDEDPETLPSAESVASTLRLLITHVTMNQTGRKYRSRDLFDLVNAPDPGPPGSWPHVDA
ncbi:MAG: SDR family NAD(P)-dependent oxidoreductase [Myxococcota bacterium]